MFPGGKRVVKAIPATAGNVITNLSPGAGKRWLILREIITLVNDATVANRAIEVVFTDGTNITERLCSTNSVLASETKILSLGEARIVQATSLSQDGTHMYVGINPILLDSNDQLRITIKNGVAGDSYSGFLVVLEIDV